MAVPFVDLKAQYASIKSEVDSAIQQVISSAAFALGPAVESFEKDFAAYCSAKNCIAVGSGTAALALLMQAHNIGSGDEVITVTNSFFASAEAISLVGATPVLIDCEEGFAHMDAQKIAAAITSKTRAIIPVHLYGQVMDIDAVKKVIAGKNILIFEDACQAHGAKLHGKTAGSLADGAAFSFYPGKNLGAYGEAGAITVNDDAIAQKIRALRDHGMTEKYMHRYVGTNERMDGIQGAVLGVKLKHLEIWNNVRRARAAQYRIGLMGVGDLQLFDERDGGIHNYHLFVVRTKKREALMAHLKEKGIQSGIHYPVPIHLQEAYKNIGWKQGDFPVAEKIAGEIVSLPMFGEMTEAQAAEVIEGVRSFFM